MPPPLPCVPANVPEVVTVSATNLANKYNGTRAGEAAAQRNCGCPCSPSVLALLCTVCACLLTPSGRPPSMPSHSEPTLPPDTLQATPRTRTAGPTRAPASTCGPQAWTSSPPAAAPPAAKPSPTLPTPTPQEPAWLSPWWQVGTALEGAGLGARRGCVTGPTYSWAPGHGCVSWLFQTSAANLEGPSVSLLLPTPLAGAGVAATFLGANPGATPRDVSSFLTSSATPNKVTGQNLKPGTPNRLLFSRLDAQPAGGGEVQAASGP